jgi:hypothetical protein
VSPAVPPDALGPKLERLPGVLAAAVFDTPPAGARAYLAVRDDADHAAIRAAALALLRDHGFTADPDRIHLGSAPATNQAVTTLPSLSLDALDIRRAENLVECAVRLRTGGRTVSGVATEPDTPAGRARAAARATLIAAEALDPELRLGLHGALAGDLFGFRSLAVLVEASLGRTQVHLPGTALVDRSLEHAGAMATLRALRSWTA